MTLAQLRNMAGITFACCVVAGAGFMTACRKEKPEGNMHKSWNYPVKLSGSPSSPTANPSHLPPPGSGHRHVWPADTVTFTNNTGGEVILCDDYPDAKSIFGKQEVPIAASAQPPEMMVSKAASRGKHELRLKSGNSCTYLEEDKDQNPLNNPIIIINR